ncbi:MAG: FAD-binding oxidoreductase [Desulfomonile tiedjei]|nr:FAD-binding oxidoreductase [Desulfomonile tiedjei]
MDIDLLHEVMSPKMVVTDSATVAEFSVDGMVPGAVVYPANLGQAGEVLKLANKENWGVIPWGGGTKMALGKVPSRFDLALSTSRLDKIIDIDVANLTVTAQAGVRLADLQDLLGGTENRCFFPVDGDLKTQADYMCSGRDYKGVFLPLDPPFSDRVTLGGMVAANSTGPKRLRYGLPRDLILGMRYVSPTGEIIGMGGKTVKNVSGYDVSKIMIGSLGTLGILGDVTFRLLPLPEQVATVVAAFGAFDAARAFADRVLGSKLLPTSLEILNRSGHDLTGLKGLNVPPGGWCVAVALEGFSEEVEREVADLKDMAKRENALELAVLDREKATAFWKTQSDCCLAPAGQGKAVVKFKGSFLISHYAEVMNAWTAASSGYQVALTVSAGLGLAYAYIFCEPDADLEKIAELGAAFRSVAEQYEGSMVAECAPASLKQRLDPWGSPQGDFLLMTRIKDSVDPRGVLNPGRFLGGL